MPPPETREEILERIHLGEDSSFEMKAVQFSGDRVSGPRRDGFADEMAAFANAKGGVCILGIDDRTREITGIPIERLDTAEAFVREVANDSIEPSLLLDIEKTTLPAGDGTEHPVLVIRIDRSLFVHRSAGGYFYRVGSSKRQMSPDFLARLFQQRSQSRILRFDEQLVPDCHLSDLDSNLVARFGTARGSQSRDQFLLKLGMAGRDNGNIIPTVAGVLLGATDSRRWIPNAFIQAVAYQGNDIAPNVDRPYQLDASDCSGPLDQQVVDACRFVFRNMKTAAFKHMGRRDVPQYDMEAVFEALTNAVAHRDYSIHASKIRLRMFSNRIEIYSPGTLPNMMDLGSLAWRQAARNETIASLLARCPIPELDWLKTSRKTMMDRRGEGVPIILERSEQLSGQTPLYELFDDAELRLTIYAADPTEDGANGG